MTISWYKKCMPRIKDVKPHLSNIVESIRNLEGIKYIYAWGSYVENHSSPNFRVKDIDIIVETDFNSGDLLAVDDKIIKENNVKEYLEEQGFYPPAIKFSKSFVELTKYNVDHWAISSDHKLLHWGPILVNKEESDEMNKEAEDYTLKQTGYNRSKINKSSEDTRKNWYKIYYNYINQNFTNMPSGWFKTEDVHIKEILAKTIKI